MRKCKKCGLLKSEDDFYLRGSWRHLICKTCYRIADQRYRKKNIERIRAYDRARSLTEHRKKAAKKRYHQRISTPDGREAMWKNIQKNESKIARKAYIIVETAIRHGKLKSEPCCRCGAKKTHAHHENYLEPLNIIWLCTICHGERHREINEMIRNGENLSERGV